jgi:hypothetical protein
MLMAAVSADIEKAGFRRCSAWSDSLTDEDAQRLELGNGRRLLGGGDGVGPLQRVVGDDGVARDDEAVVGRSGGVAGLQQHASGDLRAVLADGSICLTLPVAVTMPTAPSGRFWPGHGDAVARVEVGGFVLEQVAQVHRFGETVGISDLLLQ